MNALGTEKFPILFRPTLKAVIVDVAARVIVLTGVTLLFVQFRKEADDRILWPILLTVALILLSPLLPTLILFANRARVQSPSEEEIQRMNADRRAANVRAIWVGLLSCLLVMFAILIGRPELIPYPMMLPVLLLVQKRRQ
jgi:hypothetical protein